MQLCHVLNTLEACHEPRSDSAKNSILSSSCGTAVALSCGCIKHTAAAGLHSRSRLACLMVDQQLKPKATAPCPSCRDFKTTLVTLKTPAIAPVGSLTYDHQTQEQRRPIGGYFPWSMQQHQRHIAAPEAAVLVRNNNNAFEGRNHNRYHCARALQLTAKVGGNVVATSSNYFPPGIRQ